MRPPIVVTVSRGGDPQNALDEAKPFLVTVGHRRIPSADVIHRILDLAEPAWKLAFRRSQADQQRSRRQTARSRCSNNGHPRLAAGISSDTP